MGLKMHRVSTKRFELACMRFYILKQVYNFLPIGNGCNFLIIFPVTHNIFLIYINYILCNLPSQ